MDNEGYDLFISAVCLVVGRSKYAAIGDRVIKNALEMRGAMGIREKWQCYIDHDMCHRMKRN